MLKYLPTLNAFLNATSGILLVLGWLAIKKGNQRLHQRLMLAAFTTSTIFLGSYLTYHFLKGVVTPYPHEGLLKGIYLTILISHSILAPFIPIFAITAIVFAYQKKFEKHKKITRWLFPAWMYISVTGVVIYLMLYEPNL